MSFESHKQELKNKISVDADFPGINLRPAENIEYSPEEGVVYYDIFCGDDLAGNLDIGYDLDARQARIDSVDLESELRRKGIGKALYRMVLNLPLPNGEDPRQEGFTHVTGYHSDDAEQVWMSLEKSGIAEKIADRSYIIR